MICVSARPHLIMGEGPAPGIGTRQARACVPSDGLRPWGGVGGSCGPGQDEPPELEPR